MSFKISVLTPCYNAEKTLQRAINSVKAQQGNFEHIVVDGGSSDNTLKILEAHDHIIYISENDNGQSDAMNKAFKLSSGDIIVYLNADDWFEDGVFKMVFEYFERNPQLNFLVGNLYKVFPDKKVFDQPSTDLFEILDYWPCKFPLNPVSYFYKRKVQEKVGPFPLDNHYTMDYWFLLRAYRQFEIHHIDEIFGYFSLFDNKSADVERARKELKKVHDEFLHEFPFIKYSLFLKKYKQKLGRKLRKLIASN